MGDPTSVGLALRVVDQLVICGTVRRWGRILLLVCSLGLLILVSLLVFGLEGWRSLAVLLAFSYSGLATWYGSYRSNLWLLIGGAAAVGMLSFTLRVPSIGDWKIVVVALPTIVLISELVYRWQLAKIGGGHALTCDPEPADPGPTRRMLRIAPALRQKLLALLLVVAATGSLVLPVMLEHTSLYWGFIFIILLRYAGKVLRRARRLEALGGREAVSLDKRPPILILRSFRDDQIVVEGGAFLVQADETTDKDLRDEKRTLEEELSTALSARGPVIALGVPGETVTPLGAARDYLSENDWQTAIRHMMCDAQAIVVIAGSSPGLAWELAEIRQHEFLTKTLVIVPPLKVAARDSKGLNLFGRRKTVEAHVDASGRIGGVLEALGVSDAVALNPDSVRVFHCSRGALMAFASRFRGVASVVEAATAAMTHIPEPGRRPDVQVSPSRSRATAFLLGYAPSLGLPAALAILACTPLLFFAGVGEYAGVMQSSGVAGTLLFAVFAVNLALLCTALFCWLVKAQGRYVCGREYMEDVLEGMATSLLPLFAAFAVLTLASVFLGIDAFRFAKLDPLSAMEVLPRWHMAAAALVSASVVWVWLRFIMRLRRLWGSPLRNVMLNASLAAIVSVGLFFLGRLFVNAELSGEFDTRQLTQSEEEKREKQDLQQKLCREFGPDAETDALRWASSLPNIRPEVLILTDDKYKITGYRYCVGERVPLWVLLRAEFKYRLAAKRTVSPGAGPT